MMGRTGTLRMVGMRVRAIEAGPQARGWVGGAAALALLAGCAESGGGARPGLSRAAVAAAATAGCVEFSFPIYFQPGSDQLTVEARQVIVDSAARIRGCRIGGLEVVGLADAEGRRASNPALAERRAAVVGDTLKAAGLPAPDFDIAVGGKSGRARRGFRDLLHRRTEVVIRASPNPAG